MRKFLLVIASILFALLTFFTTQINQFIEYFFNLMIINVGDMWCRSDDFGWPAAFFSRNIRCLPDEGLAKEQWVWWAVFLDIFVAFVFALILYGITKLFKKAFVK